ncbi:hypothetical protein ACFOOM_06450 [Streptomyces echinoruber]|uniref:Secreted protein n=1 Tax=Streptomyces echinoruber TaxID=68898 RepID=A0A918QYS7_9ACTN|nr:hypothetical protein [Streptomyces echinoruber]GGZ78727.1 hypothetical protein GCM10010389_15330 [Streptomyces echinoruber]
MFSMRKAAAISGLVGGLVLTCTGITQAHAKDPGTCTRDALGDITCTQRITGVVPEGGAIPHQETCRPVQPATQPAAMGSGTTQFGPSVTCSPETGRAPAAAGGTP